MRATSQGSWTVRVSVTLLIALSLILVALSAALPTTTTHVVAQDDDEGDDDGGEIDEGDEDANRGNGNDEDGEDDDNPGRGNDKDKNKDKKDDDEDDFVTAVPTRTPADRPDPTTEKTSAPTTIALTPVGSPTRTATPPPTTGTLVIRLRACPDGTDPAVGTAALREECPAGEPDADFELAGRSGLFDGWRRDVTTDDDGDARVARLAEGTYALTLDELDWCAAEASAVDDGLIVIEPGDTTEVTAYLCGDDGRSTPAGS